MSYHLAAGALVWLRLGFTLFILFGGLLPLHWPHLVQLYLPAVTWGCAAEFLGLPCLLTPLENRLRRAAGDAGYNGDLVEHHLLSLIYPADLTPAVQRILGATVLLVSPVAYPYLWHRHGSC